MKQRMLIPLALLALAARATALSEEGKKMGDELVTTLQEEMKAMAVGDDENHEAASLKQFIRQIQLALAEENNRNLEQVLDNFGNYEPSKKALDGIAAIRKSVKDEQRRKTEELIAELQGILDAARDKVVRAEEPEDLDKILATLSRDNFSNMSENAGYESNNMTLRALLTDISNARQFVTNWQDYLQANVSGNASQAAQALRNLASQDNSLIPRSQIIARLDFSKSGSGADMNTVIDGIKTLDDMKPAIEKLSNIQGGLRNSSSENPELREALQTLVRMEKTYREFRAGLPVNIEVISTASSSSETAAKLNFIELRAELLLTVLPRCLGLPERFHPATGETVDQFLDRATKDAASRGELSTCRRVQTVRQSMAQANGISTRDVDNLRDYEAGRKQFAAGQYMLAVVSLQNALKSGGELIPAAKIGEMLDLIRKDHPEEYEKGMTEFLTPRASPDAESLRTFYRNSAMSSRFQRADPRFQDGDPRFQGGDPRNQGGTTLVLPIPAKEDAPENTAAKAKPAAQSPPAEEKPQEKAQPPGNQPPE